MDLRFFTNISLVVGFVAGFAVTFLFTIMPQLLYAFRTRKSDHMIRLSLDPQGTYLFLGGLFGYFSGGLFGAMAGGRLTEMYGPLLGLMGGNVGGIVSGIIGGCIKVKRLSK